MSTTTSPAFEQILSRFPHSKRNGHGAIARCPAHDDHNASLSISQGEDGRILMHCHAGCTFEAITSALGVKAADLMPPRDEHRHVAPKHERRIVAIYSYHDAAGKLLYESVRFDPKDFRQRRPDGKGGRVWNMDGMQRVLYRLPAIVGAGPDSIIFDVEGEKDADNLTKRGAIATTNPGGAGKWAHVDDKPLYGRHVVILPDNDDPGRNHAQEVATALHGKAASVRVLELPNLPPKGDVSDWLNAGGDVEELIRMAEAAPLWTPSATKPAAEHDSFKRRFIMRRGDSIDDEIAKYLWRNRIQRGGITVIFSRPGRGKTTLGAYITGCITTGRPWPDGSPCSIGDVIYIKGEGTDAIIRARMDEAGADPARYVVIGRADDADNAMIDLALDVPLLAEALDNTKAVIVDTLDSLYPSMRMIDNANIRRCLWPLQELAEQRGLAVIILAHTNKGGYADPLDRLSGGRAIGAAARAIWYLGKTDPHEDDCYFASVKCNDFVPAGTLAYQIVGTGPDRPGCIQWGAESDLTAWDLDGPPKTTGHEDKAEACQQWLHNLLAAGPVRVAEVNRQADAASYGRRVMSKAKAVLETKSIAQPGKPPPPDYYLCLPGQSPTTYQPPDVVILDRREIPNVTTPKVQAGRAGMEGQE